ncbi:hypothetical protein ROT00_07340 [Agromyces mediolanus]
MKVSIIASNPPTGDAVVIEGEGDDEASATAAAKAKAPPGWRVLSIRRV